MRIATWNVNSLKARLEKVSWWLERARPDVLLMQETKLADQPRRWPSSALPATSWCTMARAVERRGDRQPRRDRRRGDQLRRTTPSGADARCRGRRAAGGGADDGRDLRRRARRVAYTLPMAGSVGSKFYEAKLAWYERLARWLEQAADPAEPLVLGGDFNVAPEDQDVWDPRPAMAGPTSPPPEREASSGCVSGVWWTPTARVTPSPGATPGGITARGPSTRTSACGSITCWSPAPVAERTVSAEIDREARKGKPIPSDHAPLVIDLDARRPPLRRRMGAAEGRIAAAARR